MSSNMPIKEVIATARRLVNPANGSAQECLRSAERANEQGDTEAARRWARKSIAYSVSVFHSAYRDTAAS